MRWLIFATCGLLGIGLRQHRRNATAKRPMTLSAYRLSFAGNRFQIQSKDDEDIYAGTVGVNPARQAAIDLAHTDGA